MSYPESAGMAMVGQSKRATVRERLIANISFHERALEKNRKALDLLNENPAFEKLHDLLSDV